MKMIARTTLASQTGRANGRRIRRKSDGRRGRWRTMAKVVVIVDVEPTVVRVSSVARGTGTRATSISC